MKLIKEDYANFHMEAKDYIEKLEETIKVLADRHRHAMAEIQGTLASRTIPPVAAAPRAVAEAAEPQADQTQIKG